MNRLTSETSSYLVQHSENPVEWWPWNEQALQQARSLDRPIMLSIGYSACHWCHVMAHESFEDPEVAEVMNRLFINIKVDREERPDIDQIYQSAHYMLTKRAGGWPLTMFLAPDCTPFFGGTYFPKTPRHGLPGFVDLLERVAEVYRNRRSDIEEQNASMRATLARMANPQRAAVGELTDSVLRQLVDMLLESHDHLNGGFGSAPKFPQTPDLEFLLYKHGFTDDAALSETAIFSLQSMAKGGIYDQLGGGFFRYSVDRSWQIPHFEKMLYDNAALLGLCTQAWQACRNPLFARVVEETASWVIREMQSEEGAYYSSLDADSEGHEGRFYVWDRLELQELLGPPGLLAVVEEHYGLNEEPNFEQKHWHLSLKHDIQRVASKLSLSSEVATEQLEEARRIMFEARLKRVRPSLDRKILTSWNGLMIAGMMKAARTFRRQDWLDSARRALDFLIEHHWRDKRLLATSCGGEARLNAYLDDHAFLLNALLESIQTDYRPRDMEFALELANSLLENFEDPESGGFFFTRHDHETLIQRPKPMHDNSTPSGNGVAARVLLRLGYLSGESRFIDAARGCLEACQSALTPFPNGSASLALALAEQLTPPTLAILRGPKDELEGWRNTMASWHWPEAMLVYLPHQLTDLPSFLDKPVTQETVAYLCRGAACLPPITDIDTLKATIRED